MGKPDHELNEQIRKHYFLMTRKELSEMLGVSINIISIRASRMNLRKTEQRKDDEDEEKTPEGAKKTKSGFLTVEGNKTIHRTF